MQTVLFACTYKLVNFSIKNSLYPRYRHNLFAKDFGTDADKGAALGNGDGVIVGHAPGALVEVGRGGEEGGLGTEEEFVGGVEVGADADFVVGIRCHAHHA